MVKRHFFKRSGIGHELSQERPSRVALGAALIVTFLTLAGCSTTDLTPTHTPTSHKSAPPYRVEDSTGGFIYREALSGYAVTFPQRPDVEPLEGNEFDQPAYYVSADLASGYFVSIGQVINKTPNLRAQLMGDVSSMNPSGQITASSYTLGGLDADQAQFTTGKVSGMPSNLVGLPAELVVAGDGHHFYNLTAIGGTSDQRQAFFDSFKRIDK
jgi:hypothetical protein